MTTLADKIADGSIKHVVLLMLENRSFDEYFGTFPATDNLYTLSAAQATQSFMGPSAQHPLNPLVGLDPSDAVETPYLPARLSSFTRSLSWPALAGCNHIWDGQHTAWANGAMNGWQQSFVPGLNNSAGCVGYYLQNDIPYHWAIAANFVLCDAYHCSVLGPTEPNRMYFLAGTAVDPSIAPNSPAWPQASDPRTFMGQFSGGITGPNYNEAPSPAPPEVANWVTPTFQSYADFLTANGTSWKIYDLQGDGDPYDQQGAGSFQLNLLAWFPTTWNTLFPNGTYSSANSAHFVRDDTGNGGALAQFTADVNNHSAATPLPTVSWIFPEYSFSEHPSFVPWDGAAFVANIVSVLLNGPADLWESTVFIWTYDENDGHYDHALPVVPSPTMALASVTALAPLGTSQPSANQDEFLLDDTGNYQPIGCGFRVPAFVISPWTFNAPQNICSTLFDHTSVLRFLEDVTGAQCPNISDWRRHNFSSLSVISANDVAASAATILQTLPQAVGNAGTQDNTGTIQGCADARQAALLGAQGADMNGDYGWPVLAFPPLSSPPAWPPVAQGCTVIVTVPSYSQADVAFQAGSGGTATFGAAPAAAALLVIVDGFEPAELSAPAGFALAPPTTLPLTGNPAHICTSRVPSVIFVDASGASVPGLTATAQSIDLDPGEAAVQTLTGVPQRFTFSFSVSFDNNFGNGAATNIFPAASGAIPTTIAQASFAIDAVFTAAAEIQLLSSDDPQFYHDFYQDIDYLSNELRVFSLSGGQMLFGAPLGSQQNPAGTTADDALSFIQTVIENLNQSPSWPAQPLNVGGTIVQVGSFDDLPVDETDNPLPLYASANGIPVFNFALARVRMNAATNAQNVRVFFRSFRASVTTSAFDPVSDFVTEAQFRSNPPEAMAIAANANRTPLLGVMNVPDATGQNADEYVTIPFFASKRAPLLTPPQTMMQQTDLPNTRTIDGNAQFSTTTSFFGCWLDINQTTALIPATPPPGNWDGPWPGVQLQPIQQAFKFDLHQCLVAEISFYEISIPAGEDPASSPWLAQRNLGLVLS